MFTPEQIRAVCDAYFEGGRSQEGICDAFGYPSQATLSRWIRHDERYEGPRRAGRREEEGDQQPRPTVKYPFAVRAEAVRLALEEGMTRRQVSDRLGLCGAPMVSKWVTAYRKRGLEGLLTRDDTRQAPAAAGADPEMPGDVDALKREVEALRLENAILGQKIDILKKDPGVDTGDLTNRERAQVIDALRPTFPLNALLDAMGIARSSYYHHRRRLREPDKWAAARDAIREEFLGANSSRGYRYVHEMVNRREGVSVGERKVRELMADEGLSVVYNKKKRRYSSYAGEVSEAPENLVGRDFHADAPNVLWLTDITEFRLPDDDRKVYLSPILDCFDGYLQSWSIGTRPTAELANSSLRSACGKLAEGESPICHSDRGGHYRWDGWIGICEENGVTRSMSRKGCSPDNSACEGLFGRVKNEFFYYRDWHGVTAEEFIDRLDAFLHYYNEERAKESLGWMSPVQYRESLGLAA